MTKYIVPFVQVASATVTVEARSREEALKIACEEFDYPDANASNDFELVGEWESEAEAKWLYTAGAWEDQDQILENAVIEVTE